MALELFEMNLCGCGCGQWAPEAHDPETEGQWLIVDDDAPVCYAGAVLQEWQEKQPKLEPGLLPFVRRMTSEELEQRA